MYLGIDLGTSEVKVLLSDGEQRIVASAHAPLAIARPQPLRSEQHPADWWQATQTAIAAIQASHPHELAALRGIGLSGRMHGAVLLDAAGQALRPAILWNDVRAATVCRAPAVVGIAEPRADCPAALMPRYERYRKLYANLKNLF